jgi:hypothetical protein
MLHNCILHVFHSTVSDLVLKYKPAHVCLQRKSRDLMKDEIRRCMFFTEEGDDLGWARHCRGLS